MTQQEQFVSAHAPGVRVRGRHVRVLLCVLVALLVWVRNWRFPDASASPVLDPSFLQGLGYALLHRMQFGTQIVYTYGPLGWFNGSTHQVGLDWIAIFAWELGLKLSIAVFVGLAAFELRSWTALLLFAVAWIVPEMGNDAYFFAAIATVAAWCIARTERHCASSLAPLLVPLLVLVVIALDKFTYTMLVVVAVGCIAAAGTWVRGVKVGAAFALMFVAAWWALGQSPGNLFAWFATSAGLVSAYGTAQSIAPTGRLLVAAVVVLVLAAAMFASSVRAWRAGSGGERRKIALVALAFAAGLVLAYKAGFTRASGNEICLFAYAAPAVFLVPEPAALVGRARAWFVGLRAAVWASALVGFAMSFARYSIPPSRIVPIATGRIALNVKTLLHVREHEDMRAAERVDLARKYGLPRMKKLVGDATIDVFGSEQAFVFLNDMNWRPRPVFQGYCVMTDAFSAMNERFLAGPDGPRFMLYLPDSIDYRLPGMEDARSLARMLRDYRAVLRERGMLLLERRKDAPREMHRELLLERELAPGEALDLSSLAGDVLQLEVGTRLDARGRLRALALGAPELWLETTTSDGDEISYRIIPSMLEYGAIVRPWLQSPGDWVSFLAGDKVHSLTSVRFAADSSGWRTPFVVRVWRADDLRPEVDAQTDARLRWSMFTPIPTRFELSTPAEPTVLRGYLDALVVQAPSTLTWELEARTYRLHAVYGFLPSAWREGPTDGLIARVEVRRKGGARDVVFERKLDPRRDPLDSKLSSLDFDVKVETGDEVCLTTDPGPAGDTQRDLLFWTDVGFTPAP